MKKIDCQLLIDMTRNVQFRVAEEFCSYGQTITKWCNIEQLHNTLHQKFGKTANAANDKIELLYWRVWFPTLMSQWVTVINEEKLEILQS